MFSLNISGSSVFFLIKKKKELIFASPYNSVFITMSAFYYTVIGEPVSPSVRLSDAFCGSPDHFSGHLT